MRVCLFLAATAAFAFFASAGAVLAAITTFAVIFATAGCRYRLFLAAIAAFALFASAGAILAIVAAFAGILATTCVRRCEAGVHRYICVRAIGFCQMTARTGIRAGFTAAIAIVDSKRGCQGNECQNGNSEYNVFDLRHDNVLSVNDCWIFRQTPCLAALVRNGKSLNSERHIKRCVTEYAAAATPSDCLGRTTAIHRLNRPIRRERYFPTTRHSVF